MDKMLVKKVCELTRQGKRAAFVSIIDTKGSTPRKVGTTMLVEQTGRIWGTIGGGCGEAEVKRQSLLAMDEGRSCLYQVNLLNGLAADEGMVCGGVMEVFIQVLPEHSQP
jgi:xanthine dehydrogenase accessory factor